MGKQRPKEKLTALSFFSGALGLDLGLELAGIHSVLYCEFDKASRKTIEANRPNLPVLADVLDYSAADIRKAAGLTKKEEIDVIVGGPPCQAFSTAGKRQGFVDDRGNVFLHYLDLILDLRPRYAVIENVRGLLSAALKHRPHEDRGPASTPLAPDEMPGGALHHAIQVLKAGGYSVSFNLYNSANFGAPQVRERVIIICARDGSKVPYLTPTHSADGSFGLPKWRTFKEAVKGLKEKDMHSAKFSENRLKYYRLLKPGQYWKHLPEKLQKEALGNSYYAGGGKTGFFRRLAWEKPSPTLVTHPAMPATDLAHPVKDRPLSVEEYKRIQEFPDDWVIAGGLNDQYRQIGNAVPVSLGRAVGRAILDHASGKRPSPAFLGFPYSRYKMTDDVSWELDRSKQQSNKDRQMSFDLEPSKKAYG
jgi:DNA (cytosine-5)-methyltransferase 1